MIKLLLFGCVICPFILFAQSATDTIVWSGRRLTWENFKGNYDTATYNRQHLATTLWKLRYEYKPVPSKQQIVLIIYVWFGAAKSWVRTKSKQSKSLLQHEQGHFDLAELLARQFRRQVTETNFNTANYKDSLNNIFNKLLVKAYTQQTKYDQETSYGISANRQEFWQSFIAVELKKTELYQNKNVITTLTK